MIRYRLQCAKSHEFEAWFASGDAFDAQVAKRLVTCPDCGSAKVTKALMAPSVVTSEQKSASRSRRRKAAAAASDAPSPAVAEAAAGALMAQGPQREMLRQIKELRDKVLSEAEYVGPRFADEARKIHNDEAPQRGIYGEANLREVKELVEDGIEVMPVPVLPDDKN